MSFVTRLCILQSWRFWLEIIDKKIRKKILRWYLMLQKISSLSWMGSLRNSIFLVQSFKLSKQILWLNRLIKNPKILESYEWEWNESLEEAIKQNTPNITVKSNLYNRENLASLTAKPTKTNKTKSLPQSPTLNTNPI